MKVVDGSKLKTIYWFIFVGVRYLFNHINISCISTPIGIKVLRTSYISIGIKELLNSSIGDINIRKNGYYTSINGVAHGALLIDQIYNLMNQVRPYER